MTPPNDTPEPLARSSPRLTSKWRFWTVALACAWLPLLATGILFSRWHGNGNGLGDIYFLGIKEDWRTALAAALFLATPAAGVIAAVLLGRWRPAATKRLIALNLGVAGLFAGALGYAGFLWFYPDASPSFMGNPYAQCPNCRSFVFYPLEKYAAAHDGWFPRGGRDELDSLAKCVDDPKVSVHIFTSHAFQGQLRRFYDEHRTFSPALTSYRYVEGLRFNDNQPVLLYYDHPTYWGSSYGKGHVLGRPVMNTSGDWNFVEEAEFQRQLAATHAFLRAHPGDTRDEPTVEQALSTAMLTTAAEKFGSMNIGEGGGPDGTGHEFTRFNNAVWPSGAPSPTPIDPQKPFAYIYVFVGRQGATKRLPAPTRVVRAKGVDYDLVITVASSDAAYASRVEKILNDAVARWEVR